MVAACLEPDLPSINAEIPRLVATVMREQGIVARCLCGGARFCPFTTDGADAYEQFDQLHAGCRRTPA